MNKRIKVLVSAVLATVMLVLCIPFTAAAADPTSATFNFTSLSGKGTDLTGKTTLAETFNGCESTGSNYITAVTATKVYSGNGNGGKFPHTEGFLKFGTGSANGVLTFKLSKNVNKVEIVCYAWNDGENDTVKVNNGTAVAAPNSGTWGTKTFDIAATNEITITTANRAFIQSITVYFDNSGAAPACTHTYDGCEDTTCNKCDEPRTAPGHAYTNEYDAKCNNCTAGDRTVTLPAADSKLTNDVANKLGLAQDKKAYTTNKYFVTGEVTEIKDTEYGNLYIKDANGNKFYVYGVYSWEGTTRYDALTDKPAVGDTITVYGIIGTYNGTEAQMKNGWLYVEVANCEHEYTNDFDATCNKCSNGNRTVTLPAADSTLDYATITKLGLAQGHNAYTSDKYYFVGTIKEITKAQYGNLVLTDEDGNEFVVYGSYNSTGDTGFSSMTDPFEVGDKVKVYGIVGAYSGKAQIKDGWLSAYTAGSGNQGGGTTSSPDTNDSVVAYIAVAVVALFGIAYVSKKH